MRIGLFLPPNLGSLSICPQSYGKCCKAIIEVERGGNSVGLRRRLQS